MDGSNTTSLHPAARLNAPGSRSDADSTPVPEAPTAAGNYADHEPAQWREDDAIFVMPDGDSGAEDIYAEDLKSPIPEVRESARNLADAIAREKIGKQSAATLGEHAAGTGELRKRRQAAADAHQQVKNAVSKPGAELPQDRVAVRKQARREQLAAHVRQSLDPNARWTEKLPDGWMHGDSMISEALMRGARHHRDDDRETFSLLDTNGHAAGFIAGLGRANIKGRQVMVDPQVSGWVQSQANAMGVRNHAVNQAHAAQADIVAANRALDEARAALAHLEGDREFPAAGREIDAAKLSIDEARSALKLAKAQFEKALDAAADAQLVVVEHEPACVKYCLRFQWRADLGVAVANWINPPRLYLAASLLSLFVTYQVLSDPDPSVLNANLERMRAELEQLPAQLAELVRSPGYLAGGEREWLEHMSLQSNIDQLPGQIAQNESTLLAHRLSQAAELVLALLTGVFSVWKLRR